jgi:hypothetical protein
VAAAAAFAYETVTSRVDSLGGAIAALVAAVAAAAVVAGILRRGRSTG